MAKKKTQHALVNCRKCKNKVLIKVLRKIETPIDARKLVIGFCPECNIKLITKELQETII